MDTHMTDTQSFSYRTVTEVEDWGAVISKVIVDLGKSVPNGAVTADSFAVRVTRIDSRLPNPLVEKGDRRVVRAYVSDQDGNPIDQDGRYATLELEIGPTLSLGSAIHYNGATGFNAWNENRYEIVQSKAITASEGILSGRTYDTFGGDIRKLVDDFDTGEFTHDNVTLTYSDYSPAQGGHKKPLLIWLHGYGEGGTDPTIPIAANKAVSFASEPMQAFFGGAYVLAPQTPTFWMNGHTRSGDGTSKYQQALMALIQDYVARHPDIDESRIYIGGCSNGGYMTMLMIRDYVGYFAAAFPVCEALEDTLVKDEDIRVMKDLPIWFVTAQADTVLPPDRFTVPTYKRLLQAGAQDVHLTLYDTVVDTTGLYLNPDGTPYEYHGHFSWVYVFNNDVRKTIDGRSITLMEWLASRVRVS